jgi:hypothetical protein
VANGTASLGPYGHGLYGHGLSRSASNGSFGAGAHLQAANGFAMPDLGDDNDDVEKRLLGIRGALGRR